MTVYLLVSDVYRRFCVVYDVHRHIRYSNYVGAEMKAYALDARRCMFCVQKQVVRNTYNSTEYTYVVSSRAPVLTHALYVCTVRWLYVCRWEMMVSDTKARYPYIRCRIHALWVGCLVCMHTRRHGAEHHRSIVQ